MKTDSIQLYLCPQCGAGSLSAEAYLKNADEIIDGRLLCASCLLWYRIENGIADLLPFPLRRDEFYVNFAKKYGIEYAPSLSLAKHANEDQAAQINFFKTAVGHYERCVINSKYYKALYHLTFDSWIQKTLKPGDFVLNLGCGLGEQCLRLAGYGVRNIGLDICEEMLIRAKAKITDRGADKFVDLIVADAQNPPFVDGSFTACVFFATLHHLADKNTAIRKALQKVKQGGFFYSIDAHQSPLRFIFDVLMNIWRLYDDEASDEAVLSGDKLLQWLQSAGIRGKLSYSTYLPPHLFYLLTDKLNVRLLEFSDKLGNSLPLIRKLGGAVIAEGIKAKNKGVL